MRTRKWDLESLKLDALRFNTPTEWARGSSGAYSAASVMGVLGECCGHMVRKATPLTKDAAFALATLYPSPSDFKSAQPTAVRMLIKNGWLAEAQKHMVRKYKAPVQLSLDKHPSVWLKDDVINEAKKYTSRDEFQIKAGGAYNAARRKGWLDEACAHIPRLRRKLTEIDVLTSASNYLSRGVWKDACPSEYAAAKYHGWFDEATQHMQKLVRDPWEKDEVLAIAANFNNPTAFKDAASGAWSVAQRDGYLEEACAHMVRLAHKPSDQEREVFDFVVAMCPDAIQSDSDVLGGKQLDILIPSKGIAIEFNGLFWHSTRTGRTRGYHQAKSDAAAVAGYRLIHIWSDEWIEKQDIIKAYLRMQLVGPDRVIGARKCSIVAITPDVALPFHRMFHLQGGRGGEHFGLYHAGELLAVATVQGVELARWTVRFGTVVVGALSKMMKHIGRRIISYCDTAKHTGVGYLAAGFKQIGVAAPSYYYTEGNKRFNRVGFQKHKLLEKPGATGETEAELAASLGFYQVGGCRQLKFEFNA